jgi:hypothetical protein
MCHGICLAYHTLPVDLIERHLKDRIHENGGERAVWFLRRQTSALLPVWYAGKIRLARWGCRRGESRLLPPTGLARRASFEEGRWKSYRAERVDIPAAAALEGKVWFSVRQGLRGLLVRDERGCPRVYVLCEPASHYYEVMTRSRWMPVLIGERI